MPSPSIICTSRLAHSRTPMSCDEMLRWRTTRCNAAMLSSHPLSNAFRTPSSSLTTTHPLSQQSVVSAHHGHVMPQIRQPAADQYTKRTWPPGATPEYLYDPVV